MPKKSIKNPEAESVAGRLGLQGTANDSFIQLCNQGCDPHFLAEYLPFLTPLSRVVIVPTNKKRRSYTISLRGLDSHEDVLEGFEKRDLEALQEQTLKMAERISKLNRTRLVRYSEDEEYNIDIHTIPSLLMHYSKVFIPLLLKKYEEAGERQRPQFTTYLNAICDHVKQATGKARYRLVAEILTGIGVNMDEFALKTWRSRNKEKR
jgi:hypothetical protein